MRNENFDQFFREHEARIHFQIRRLRIPEYLYEEFYSVGLVALWNGYENFKPGKGNIGTYLNYQIRFRLIDHLRKSVRDDEKVEMYRQHALTELFDGNHFRKDRLPLISSTGLPLSNEPFWEEVRRHLTEKQWKWVKYFIIADLSIKEIAEIEGVAPSAVKSWGQEVRRKLRSEATRKRLIELLVD